MTPQQTELLREAVKLGVCPMCFSMHIDCERGSQWVTPGLLVKLCSKKCGKRLAKIASKWKKCLQ